MAKGKGSSPEEIVAAIEGGERGSLYLVAGDRVVSEPPARKIAEALAKAAGCDVDVQVRPGNLASVFNDLRTVSLFSSAKVVLAIDTAVLADRSRAADLIDAAERALPVAESGELRDKQRPAASRLLQALRLFGVDPMAGDADSALGELPDWAFGGGAAFRRSKPRGRAAKAKKQLRADLGALLESARDAGMVGFAEGDQAELEQIAEGGLPEGHALVLAEPTAAPDHPLVERLAARRAAVFLTKISANRSGGWDGLDVLVGQLAASTGSRMARDAADELARRTFKTAGGWGDKEVRSDATGRFAAEYEKLASMAGGGEITRAMVVESVEDRGEEDVWKILGAVGEGKGNEALARYRRLIAGADDPIGARLSFFSLLAGFCRQLTAIVGVMQASRVAPGERNYHRFKSRGAPALQAALPSGEKSPLQGLHPFRLHRAYLAASRLEKRMARRLPWLVLETEQRVKGMSRDGDAAIAQLIGSVAASLRPRPRR